MNGISLRSLLNPPSVASKASWSWPKRANSFPPFVRQTLGAHLGISVTSAIKTSSFWVVRAAGTVLPHLRAGGHPRSLLRLVQHRAVALLALASLCHWPLRLLQRCRRP